MDSKEPKQHTGARLGSLAPKLTGGNTMQTIPEYLMRLQAKIYASKEQVDAVGFGANLFTVQENLVRSTASKILNDCVKRGCDDNGQYVLSLDVYVLSSADLDRLIRESRADGADDVRRWNVAFARNTAIY
jgi:hypothetical protein